MEKFLSNFQFKQDGGTIEDRNKNEQKDKATGGFPPLYRCDKSIKVKQREFQSLLKNKEATNKKPSLSDILSPQKKKFI